MSFNPDEHLTQLKNNKGSSDYLEVKWRLVWFCGECPEGTIDTEEVEVDLDREITAEIFVWNSEKRRSEKVLKTTKGYARFKATVTDGKGKRRTAHGSESAVDFADYIEKAETKAVGRALAMLGFGTQFTGNELAEHHRIVDSPVENGSHNASTQRQDETTAAQAKQTTNNTLTQAQGSTTSQPAAQLAPREYLNKLFVKGREKKLFANTKEMAEQFASEVLERAIMKDDLYNLSNDELIRLDYAIAGTTGLNGAA